MTLATVKDHDLEVGGEVRETNYLVDCKTKYYSLYFWMAKQTVKPDL